jgi:thiamine monophosphate synthase
MAKRLSDMYKKIELLSAVRASQECSFSLAVDGGVTLDIAKKLIYYGVNKIAVGSAIMQASNPIEMAKKFLELSDFNE